MIMSGEARGGSLQAVSPLKLEPNSCGLCEPVKVTLDLVAQKPLLDIQWHIKFMVDLAAKQKVVDLFQPSKRVSYEEGKETRLEIEASLDVLNSAFPKSALLNVGLLQISAVDGHNEEVFSISVVTQILKEGDALKRVFLDPNV